jgi:hypothetical protein
MTIRWRSTIRPALDDPAGARVAGFPKIHSIPAKVLSIARPILLA